MKYTEEQINEILGFKGANDKLINVFDLYGVLFIGTPRELVQDKREKRAKYKITWNLYQTFVKFSEGRLAISIRDFEDCKDEEEVRDTFSELIEERVKAKLV